MGEATAVTVKGLLQREAPGRLGEGLTWCRMSGLRWSDLYGSGEAELARAVGLGRLHWLRQHRLVLV